MPRSSLPAAAAGAAPPLAHCALQDHSELRSSTEKKLLDLEESLSQERRARQAGLEQTHSALAAEVRRVSDAADVRGDERCVD